MDAEAQVRVFKRVQETYSIDQMTRENINEIMKNRSGTTTWTEKRESGKLRTRTETVKFSARKDAIARDMSQISSIFEQARTQDVQTELDTFDSRYPLTSSNKSLVEDRILEAIRGQTDTYFDTQDFSGLKNVQVSSNRATEIRDNQLYNLAGAIITDSRRSGDVARLEALRSEVQGTAAAERIPEIDSAITKLRGA